MKKYIGIGAAVLVVVLIVSIVALSNKISEQTSTPTATDATGEIQDDENVEAEATTEEMETGLNPIVNVSAESFNEETEKDEELSNEATSSLKGESEGFVASEVFVGKQVAKTTITFKPETSSAEREKVIHSYTDKVKDKYPEHHVEIIVKEEGKEEPVETKYALGTANSLGGLVQNLFDVETVAAVPLKSLPHPNSDLRIFVKMKGEEPLLMEFNPELYDNTGGYFVTVSASTYSVEELEQGKVEYYK
ncbi:hypothetical protein [Alkalihalobacillus deserti]|uniref:hypothetical protein n=1 Tax=Alkalihalobacillus deserti TaxID=2879466 RepID=UPI001D15547B|nr:hypothetical protein [Alkalihalobacillus deserti]